MDCRAIVGLYGISGSGKSHVLAALQKSRPEWRCIEGTQMLSKVLAEEETTLDEFKKESALKKEEIRCKAARRFKQFPGITIVVGHASFPKNDTFENAFTKTDAETFTHILYLEKTSDVVFSQRQQDNESSQRTRPFLSESLLERWSEYEKELLNFECKRNQVPLITITDSELVEKVIVDQVLLPLVELAQASSEASLHQAIIDIPPADVYLLIDGDRTLSCTDTGPLFFHGLSKYEYDPLKPIFKRYEDYCFQAFFEISMLYANFGSNEEYFDRSLRVGLSGVELYPQWKSFIQKLPKNVCPVILTSGNREVWTKLVESLSVGKSGDPVILLAGNHCGLHSYIVDAGAKGLVAQTLRKLHGGCKIFSFGDSGEQPFRC